jgi:hypothetical protein
MQPSADLLDLLGPPRWCSGCWPHAGEVAGGAVEIFVLVDLVGGDDGGRAVGATDDDDDVGFAWSGRW